ARAERVHAMLHRELVVGRGAILRYLVCGFAADNLIASTAGVAVRGVLLVRHGGARAPPALRAPAPREGRGGDVVGVGLWVIVHWHLMPMPFLERGYVVAFAIGLALLVGALACARLAPGTRAGRLLAPAGAALGNRTDAARQLACTLILWAAESAVLVVTLRALGVVVGLRAAVVLTTIGTLAFVVPGPPSGAGTF